jgi:conjugal transfer/entry exclusion protein
MDPLSITAAAVPLVMTCGKVAKSLKAYIEKIRNVDETLQNLEIEIQSLSSVLASISLKQNDSSVAVKPSEPLSGDERNYWKSLNQSMKHCKDALEMLAQILERINFAGYRLVPRRANLQYKLSQNAQSIASVKGQITAYRQTLELSLQLITVYVYTVADVDPLSSEAKTLAGVWESSSTMCKVTSSSSSTP